MLAAPVSDPALLPGSAGEPKWDGFRALLSVDAGQVMLRSRRGTEMLPAFPEIGAGAVQLPDATALDGELVVWDAAGRLAFERLQNRLARRAAGAARRRKSGQPTSSRSICSGCPERTRPLGRTGGGAALESVFAAPPTVGAVGAVPVDHRGRRRARVADVGVGRDGGRGLQEAGRPLPPVGERLAEQKSARRARRSSAQSPALWPLPARCCSAGTTTKGAFSTSAAPPPSPRRQVRRSPACSLQGGAVIRGQAAARSSVDRLVVLRRVGQPGKTGRHAGGTRAGGGSQRRVACDASGGATLHAGTAPAPTFPSPTSPA
ncbi:hypothetical protein ACFYRC_36325 [Streptomyces sp. NPDC005279]|uniref:ATP-dependent DNA ligase n=1 Tax=Streptomyces sp. NPDC005279 TaxID=3364712 RepID=UPI0036A14D0C